MILNFLHWGQEYNKKLTKTDIHHGALHYLSVMIQEILTILGWEQ